jgi:hypothetical protein
MNNGPKIMAFADRLGEQPPGTRASRTSCSVGLSETLASQQWVKSAG